MPKVPSIPRPEDDPSFPWMRLAQAVFWAVHRIEPARQSLVEILSDPYFPGDPDQGDVPGKPEDVRAALASGKLTAWGQRGYSDPHEPIPAIDWASRIVSMIDNSMAYEPYLAIRVSRADVLKLWPPQSASVARAGRPADFDWDKIRSWAVSEPKNQSQNSVTEVLRALCEQAGQPVPSPSRMKEKLKEWGWPTLAER